MNIPPRSLRRCRQGTDQFPGRPFATEDHGSPHDFGIAGLLGWPVAHSRSPVIHNHWLAQHGIAGRYVLFPVPPEKLEAAVRGIAALGLRGCNVTTPHKQAIFPLLDRVDDLARQIGAVNTVVVEKDGTLTGFNNDGNGFIQSLRDAEPRLAPRQRADSGARRRRRVARRRGEPRRARREGNPRRQSHARTRPRRSPPRSARWSRSCHGTSARMRSTASRCSPMRPASAWPASRRSTSRSIGLPKRALVGDLIYMPPETPLLAAARARGNITVNGLGLLLNQARPAFNAWFGVMPEITPALRAAIAATF